MDNSGKSHAPLSKMNLMHVSFINVESKRQLTCPEVNFTFGVKKKKKKNVFTNIKVKILKADFLISENGFITDHFNTQSTIF